MSNVSKDLKEHDRPINLGNPQMGRARDVAADAVARA